MTERANVTRSAFFVAAIAALVTFLAMAGIWKTVGRSNAPIEASSATEKPPSLPLTRPRISTQAGLIRPVTPVEAWTPAPVEFVTLTTAVSLYNSRGKEVKQFQVGKRLKVRERDGDKITIDYLGDAYTIAAAATAPSQ